MWLFMACINLCAYLVCMGCDFTKVGGGLWLLCSFMSQLRGHERSSTHYSLLLLHVAEG